MATKSGRTISSAKERSIKSLLVRWEFLLVLIFVAVNIMNANLSPVYLNPQFLFINIRGFLVKGMIALPMAYILLLGDIDLSVGGNVCLSATVLGIVYNTTHNMGLAILACIATGTLCGALNGILMTKFTELAPMIVTLATNIIFRGVSEKILGMVPQAACRKWNGLPNCIMPASVKWCPTSSYSSVCWHWSSVW